jgi:hypothetical protein
LRDGFGADWHNINAIVERIRKIGFIVEFMKLGETGSPAPILSRTLRRRRDAANFRWS